MSSLERLREKNCATCKTRLDKLKIRNIRTVSCDNLIVKLNNARKTILKKKKKEVDDYMVVSGDLVCKTCITFANNFKNRNSTDTRSSNRKRRRVTVSGIFKGCTSTSNDSDSSDDSYEEGSKAEHSEEGGNPQTVLVDIPRTKSTHKHCVICHEKSNLIVVPRECYFDTFVKSNILIPSGCRICRHHLNDDKTFTIEAMNKLSTTSDNTELTGYEITTFNGKLTVCRKKDI